MVILKKRAAGEYDRCAVRVCVAAPIMRNHARTAAGRQVEVDGRCGIVGVVVINIAQHTNRRTDFRAAGAGNRAAIGGEIPVNPVAFNQ